VPRQTRASWKGDHALSELFWLHDFFETLRQVSEPAGLALLYEGLEAKVERRIKGQLTDAEKSKRRVRWQSRVQRQAKARVRQAEVLFFRFLDGIGTFPKDPTPRWDDDLQGILSAWLRPVSLTASNPPGVPHLCMFGLRTFSRVRRRVLDAFVPAAGPRCYSHDLGAQPPSRGLFASCHTKVPFGNVEAINGNIRAMVCRGRGSRDHECPGSA
jgi:hypothetical protein